MAINKTYEELVESAKPKRTTDELEEMEGEE